MRVTHFDSAYSVSPKAQQILRRKLTCDAEPGDNTTERLDDLEERHDKLEDRVNNQTSGYGEVRAQQKKDGDRLDAHEQILHTLAGPDTDDEMTRETPKATEPEVPSDDSVGGSTIYGPKGQPSGYSISTGDQLRRMNNQNRRKFGLDEITDGPTAPNLTGKTDSISGNASKTQQSLNLGQTWTGKNTGDAAVFRALAPDFYRRQQAKTTDLIRSMQGKQNKQWDKR